MKKKMEKMQIMTISNFKMIKMINKKIILEQF